MTWLMDFLKIWLEERLPTKYYVIKHLIFQKIQNMTNINVDVLQWFIHFL